MSSNTCQPYATWNITCISNTMFFFRMFGILVWSLKWSVHTALYSFVHTFYPCFQKPESKSLFILIRYVCIVHVYYCKLSSICSLTLRAEQLRVMWSFSEQYVSALVWRSEFSSYETNYVTLRVTNSKSKNKNLHFELLTQSRKIKSYTSSY